MSSKRVKRETEADAVPVDAPHLNGDTERERLKEEINHKNEVI